MYAESPETRDQPVHRHAAHRPHTLEHFDGHDVRRAATPSRSASALDSISPSGGSGDVAAVVVDQPLQVGIRVEPHDADAARMVPEAQPRGHGTEWFDARITPGRCPTSRNASSESRLDERHRDVAAAPRCRTESPSGSRRSPSRNCRRQAWRRPARCRARRSAT